MNRESNDYNLTVPLVEIYSNRIVVTSAGGLVEGLSREDFFNCRSMPRNRVLMRIFRDMDLVESLGSGMTRILRAYDPAIFNFIPSFMEVVFVFETNGNDEINNVPVKTEDVGINVGIKTNGGINGGINAKNVTINPENVPVNPENVTISPENVPIKVINYKLQDKIFILVRANPKVTVQKLAHTLGVTERTIKRILKTFQDKGIVKRIGSRKIGHWEIIK